jgi:4'-phosphopantetheinyl transferase
MDEITNRKPGLEEHEFVALSHASVSSLIMNDPIKAREGTTPNDARPRNSSAPIDPASCDKLSWPIHPLPFELHQDEVHVWSCRLDPSNDLLARFGSVLSLDESERAARFRFDLHRNRFIAGRGWIRLLLGSYLKIAPEQIDFCYGEHGKPAISNPCDHKGIHFNLAHSDVIALAAVTRIGPLGLDVERLRVLKDVAELVERFFSARENSVFQELSAEARNVAFFNLWTRKEAWLKATGQGISQNLNRVEVSFVPGESPRLLALPEEFRSDIRTWSLHELTPAPGFAGALALCAEKPRISCSQWRDKERAVC